MNANTAGSGWSVGGATTRGESHIRKGLNNQDAITWAPASGAGETAVIAVSDGHGSKEHFRSEVGSKLAVDAAVAVLSDFLAKFKTAKLSAITAAAIEIPSWIHEAWQARVEADLAKTPLPSTEPPAAGNQFVPYGATLVAVATAPHFVVLVQIGDGDIVVGFSDSRLDRPLPDDTGLTGEQTYSLCDPDAVKAHRFRLQVLPIIDGSTEPEFLMLSTDGLSKSCPNDQAFLKLASDWRNAVRKGGIAAVTQSLEPWLAQASARGSGDDITLGFAARPTLRNHAMAQPPDGKLAAIESQVRLATRVSYVSLVASLLSLLLIITTLWWSARHSVASPPNPGANHTHRVDRPNGKAPGETDYDQPKPED